MIHLATIVLRHGFRIKNDVIETISRIDNRTKMLKWMKHCLITCQ